MVKNEEEFKIKNNATIEGQLSFTNDEKNYAIEHKDFALKKLDNSFARHIELEEYKQSHLLSYWFTDFANYHDTEKDFKDNTLKTLKIFKRGDVVKVNLGYNVGNELGGLHYCIVLNKKDNPYSGTLNVIPLSSSKEDKTYNPNTCIDLGDELYNLLSKKSELEFSSISIALENIKDPINVEEIKKLSTRAEYLSKLDKELSKMKHGSFALLHQITTISKQRLYKTSILSGIKVSNHSLNLIDEKIKKLYTK